MMPDAGEGIKGCAARTGTPASALDPLARIRSLADMPFRPSGVRRRGVSSLLCTTGDISNMRRQRRWAHSDTSDQSMRLRSIRPTNSQSETAEYGKSDQGPELF